jgi:hypothetical protein
MNVLSTFATRIDISQNDKAILLKAEYYLLRLNRVLYLKKIDYALYRISESQNAFPELHGKTRSLPLRKHYEGIIRLLAIACSRGLDMHTTNWLSNILYVNAITSYQQEKVILNPFNSLLENEGWTTSLLILKVV